MRTPARLALLASMLVLCVVATVALAAATPDPQNDVIDRSPCECTTYGQDLKSVDATLSGGDIVFTIDQYDSMGNAFAAAYYGPQVAIYTGGSATPTYAIIPRGDGQNHFAMSLIPASAWTPPCSGAGSGYGQGVTAVYDAGFFSATYTIHAADIGGSSFEYKVVNPGVPGCGPEPDGEATDMAPDSGLASPSAGGTPTPTPTATATATATATPTAAPSSAPSLTPAQTLPSLAGVPKKLKVPAKALKGSLTLAGPAASVSLALLAPGSRKAVGKLVKAPAPAGKYTFKMKLKPSAKKALKPGKTATLQVTVTLASGKSATLKGRIKLIR